MKLLYFPENQRDSQLPSGALIGGKGKALFALYNAGVAVPQTFCIGTNAYELFVEKNGLREKINLELHRKEIADMRWEEIWDASLRIQNLFLAGLFPEQFYHEIKEVIDRHFKNKNLVIRSSAPDEDGNAHSFAGLHESYLNVSGLDEVLKKVKKVWASLWSDRAILYRQELGLVVENSKMAVVVQEFLEGESSGIVFSKNPLDQSQLIIEAVHGLNQGLVEGAIEPDRWIFDRQGLILQNHNPPANRDYRCIRSGISGVQLQKTDSAMRSLPPINNEQQKSIAAMGIKLEQQFGNAQDVEWTLVENTVYILQSRPITAQSGQQSSDKRSWYLSLNRSYDNLLQLWENITTILLPEMDRESSALAKTVLRELSDSELADELSRRSSASERWSSMYWSECIPFAHGIRLFGELYNDVVEPADPFEFILLLTGQEMLSTDRNRTIYECARMVADDLTLRRLIEQGRLEEIDNKEFQEKLQQLRFRFSMNESGAEQENTANTLISAIILQYTALENIPQGQVADGAGQLETVFIDKAREKLPIDPEKLLEMARASYRIRDDDNIHIGRIAQELERARVHANKRLQALGFSGEFQGSIEDLSAMLAGGKAVSAGQQRSVVKDKIKARKRIRARQIQGQPASRGIARARARVINKRSELKDFKKGEILVIDSIDPTMTFFAPLAAGIIERRGGMLIHGAIIAREYGIPCITGVVDATSSISTGDLVTVDGYLGIITVQRV
jgi:phosphohistidine swiveling domain-containing protein